MTKRVPSKSANKRCLESLAQGGAFDGFEGTHRNQYFHPDQKDGTSGIEKAIRFGNAISNQGPTAQASLFGGGEVEDVTTPTLLSAPEWSKLEKLKKEKEVIGFYISGHPLDDFKFEIRQFCNCRIDELKNIPELKGRDLSFAGIIIDVSHRISKTGKPFGSFNIEDFYGSTTITLFGEDYAKLKAYLEPESLVYVKAKVQNKFHSPTDWELKPYNIQFLKDAADKLTKQVTVKLRLHDVNKELIAKLAEVLASNKGTIPVRLHVVDVERNWSIPFTSNQHKVTVQAKLLDEIKAITNGDVSLA